MTCSNWYDFEDPASTITYKIYAEVLDPVTMTQESFLLYAGSDATQDIYLGSFVDQLVILKVLVSDELGAMTLGSERYM